MVFSAQPVQHTFINLSRGILNILVRFFSFLEAMGQEFTALGNNLPLNSLIVNDFHRRDMTGQPRFAPAEDPLVAKRKRRPFA